MERKQARGSVLITGTSTGIGKVTALYLDRLGYQVFATVRNEQDVGSLQSQASERLKPVIMDVTDENSIDQTLEVVRQTVSDTGLDGLVNNAAVAFTSPLEFVPLDDLRRLFEVNLFGQLAIIQKFLPLLRLAGGRIVNVSSTASVLVAPFHGPYSASKLALNGLSDALRLELRPLGVKVSVIVFGSVKTPIWDKGGDLSKQVVQDYPPQVWDLYGANYRKLVDFFREMGKAGITPEEAAKAIHRALTDRHPKTRYYVGWDAHQFNLYNKLLAGRLKDWMVMRRIGLSEEI